MPASKNLAEVIENSTAVVMLRMQGLPGNRKVPNAEVTVDGNRLEDKFFSSPTMRLIPTEWNTRFNSVHGKAEKLIRQASPPRSETHDMPLPVGCHLIAGKRKETIAAEIQRLIDNELIPLRNSFCQVFPEIVEERRKQLNSAATWETIKATIPSASQLQAAIMLRFVVLPFTFLNEAGRAIAEEVAQSIISGIAETIEDEADKLKEKITKEQVVREKSFTALRQQFQLLKDFSFLADASTLASLEEIEKDMASRELVTEFNADMKSGANGIVAKLNAAITKLSQEAKKDAGGRFRRRIDI